MNVKEMHYDFKLKLNKIDSQQYANFLIPEIDWFLNEAQEYFIKSIAEPRTHSYHGFEKSQRSIDDIRELVVHNQPLIVDTYKGIAKLPDNYMFYVSGNAFVDTDKCKNIKCNLQIRQHDDMYEESPFDKTSVEWRHVNGVFTENGIQVFVDPQKRFSIKTLNISYIRKPAYIHNAEDFNPQGYTLPKKNILTGHRDCELSEHTHREIVDIAVALASNSMDNPNYQSKLNKLQLNQLI